MLKFADLGISWWGKKNRDMLEFSMWGLYYFSNCPVNLKVFQNKKVTFLKLFLSKQNKKDICSANKHLERCPPSLVIRGMQITLR